MQICSTRLAAGKHVNCTWQLSDLKGFDEGLVIGIPYVQMPIVKIGQQPAGKPDVRAMSYSAYVW